jgi:hypothetical protein
MKIKHFIIGILIMLSALFVFTINVSADTGPKSKVEIKLSEHKEGHYMTLLSYKASNGPFSNTRLIDFEDNKKYWTEERQKVELSFSNYNDKDGYYYWHYFSDVSSENYVWGYHPPRKFKVLIYDVNNDEFITNDEIYEPYAFTSGFKLTYSLDSANKLTFIVENDYDASKEILGFVLRLTICLAIELGIALLFKIFKKQLLIVLGANVLTQLILNAILLLYVHFNGLQFFVFIIYALLEFVIMLAEYAIYYLTLNKYANKYNYEPIPEMKLLIYTLLANFVSLVGGWIILATVGM